MKIRLEGSSLDYMYGSHSELGEYTPSYLKNDRNESFAGMILQSGKGQSKWNGIDHMQGGNSM